MAYRICFFSSILLSFHVMGVENQCRNDQRYVVSDTLSGYQFEVREDVESGFSDCVAYSILQIPDKALRSIKGSWTRSLACSLKPNGCLGDGGKNDVFLQVAQWHRQDDKGDNRNVLLMLDRLKYLVSSQHYPKWAKRIDGRAFYSTLFQLEFFHIDTSGAALQYYSRSSNVSFEMLPGHSYGVEYEEDESSTALAVSFPRPFRQILLHTNKALWLKKAHLQSHLLLMARTTTSIGHLIKKPIRMPVKNLLVFISTQSRRKNPFFQAIQLSGFLLDLVSHFLSTTHQWRGINNSCRVLSVSRISCTNVRKKLF